LILLIGMPLGLLLGLEGALRVAGYGYPTSFFLSHEVKGKPAWVNNAQFGLRFFPRAVNRNPPPLALPKLKPPGQTRVFVFGESAALGVPAPEYGFSVLLEALLKGRFPGRDFEVINTAIVAINSHVVLPIAQECAGREGDLWVIYMGNNEVIGPFGAQGVFGATAPSMRFVRAGLALKKTRVGQLLDAGLQRLSGRSDLPPQWGGMQMFKQLIGRDDPRIRRVHQHFRENLEDILAAGRKAGVPIVLCTVPSNLKDCSPFGSLHSPGLTAEQTANWDSAYQAGMAHEAEGQMAEALADYQAAAVIDPRFALLQFRLGTCCLALGRAAEAQDHFQRAKDEDALQFRPDTRLNEIIRQVAVAQATKGVRLTDAEKIFADHSAGGVPGAELFYEHVHLTPDGNYLLARATAESASALLPPGHGPPQASQGEWLSQAECEDRAGLTEWGRSGALEIIRDMINKPPFTTQSVHSNEMQRLTAELRRLHPGSGPAGVRQALAKVEQAQRRHPDDAALLMVLGSMLTVLGDLRAAEQWWRELTRTTPCDCVAWLNLARVLRKQGRIHEAEQAFKESLQQNSDGYEANGDLGWLLLQEGRPSEAIPHIRVLVKQQPRSVDGHLALGRAYREVGNPAQAHREFLRVLELDPNNKQAQRLLEEVSGG
jgi:tetratricopeptide (TPR) repeat protein